MSVNSQQRRHNSNFFTPQDMPKMINIYLGVLTHIILGLTLWSCIEVTKLSLPLSPAIAILNVCVAIAACALYVGLSKPQLVPTSRSKIMCVAIYLLLIIPVILATLSAPDVASMNLQNWRVEQQWDHFFRSKNENAIKSIQDQLHCCGLHSMRDRAWPFPSRDTDAGTCEKTSGFETRCGTMLANRLCMAAAVDLTGSVLGALMTVVIAYRALVPSSKASDTRDDYVGIDDDDLTDVGAVIADEQRRQEERPLSACAARI